MFSHIFQDEQNNPTMKMLPFPISPIIFPIKATREALLRARLQRRRQAAAGLADFRRCGFNGFTSPKTRMATEHQHFLIGDTSSKRLVLYCHVS